MVSSLFNRFVFIIYIEDKCWHTHNAINTGIMYCEEVLNFFIRLPELRIWFVVCYITHYLCYYSTGTNAKCLELIELGCIFIEMVISSE